MEKNKKITQFDLIRVVSMCAVIVIHLFAKAGIDSFTSNQWIAYESVPDIMRFAVPNFLMVSGALILPKTDDLIKTFRRCRRLILALILFGIPAAVLENIFVDKVVSISTLGNALLDTVAGRTWDVYWFLYMMIGMYMIFPILQRALKNMTLMQNLYFIAILYVFSAVVPFINKMAGTTVINFYLPIDTWYLLYPIVGYVIINNLDKTTRRRFSIPAWLVVITYICVMVLNYSYEWGLKDFLKAQPIVILYSIAIFIVLFSMDTKENRIMSCVSKYSFGVYLVHCYFTNFILKFLNIVPTNYPLYISIPVMAVVVLMLSLFSVMILYKIPPIKKYIL